MKKILFYFLLAIVFLLIGVLILTYAPNKSLEELKEDWTYPNSQFVEIQDMPVHYRINGTGHPIILVHGTAASLHTWEKWTEILQDSLQVISLDMPAFGLTGPNPKADYSIDFYTQFLEDFTQKIGIDSFHLAGNSLGGSIAWQYAVQYPNKVKKLILLDAGGYPRKDIGDVSLAFRLAKSDFWNKLLLHFTPKSLFESSLAEVYGNDSLITDDLVNRYYQLYLRKGNRQAFVDRTRTKYKDRHELIKTIQQPTLIQWGDQDQWIKVENAHRFQDDLPHSTLIVYENIGHIPMEEIPAQTAHDALRFLME